MLQTAIYVRSLLTYDVVIPCYNRAAFVDRAVESVLSQTSRPERLILVDDGSTDHTAEVLQRLERDHLSVHAAILPRNVGASAARNAGLALAREPWIAFLDSDDQWLPDAAEALLHAATPDKLDVVVGHFCRVWPSGKIDKPECGWSGVDIKAALATFGAVGPSWSLVRTDLAREVGGFDPSFHNCNDWDFYTRAAAAGARFGRIDATIALYQYANSGRLSHDHELGSSNAARVRAHRYFSYPQP